MRSDQTGSANDRPVFERVDSLAEAELTEVAIAADVDAPGGARTAVEGCLRGRVADPALADALLLVSELASNSVRHSGAAAGDHVVVSVALTPRWFRVGVLDPGSGAVIEVRSGAMDNGGGWGLFLVQALSERWGVERLAAGGTQVWAQLARVRAGEDEGAARSETRAA